MRSLVECPDSKVLATKIHEIEGKFKQTYLAELTKKHKRLKLRPDLGHPDLINKNEENCRPWQIRKTWIWSYYRHCINWSG